MEPVVDLWHVDDDEDDVRHQRLRPIGPPFKNNEDLRGTTKEWYLRNNKACKRHSKSNQ